ncbi:MAG TPA: beta-L-arabinofuranosidase domain-containing protein [Verrucomicrobiae bacterium]|nr:beta-L-arabinofuranosidase domain-containing protein [Verrucomicrobiae bacterium]
MALSIVICRHLESEAQVKPDTNTRLTATPFALSQVCLQDGPFKEREDVNARFLLTVDTDRLLARFRQEAGLAPKAEPYRGWESKELGGHSLGHYLSALSLLYASTGSSHALERIRYIIDELDACQTANGGGYVLSVPRRVFEDLRQGKIKASGANLNDCWAPNYTLHKMLAGLRDAYRLAGNNKALEVERKFVDWLADVLSGLTEAQIQEMLKAEHGGMNEVLADLAADAGDARYLRIAEREFHHKAVLDPLANGEDNLNGLHGNTQIPKVIGLAREYEMTSNPKCRVAVETFWDSVVNRRSFAMGGHGESEYFFPPEQFPEKLTPYTAETCNTYNMIKLTGHLFSWEPKAAHMDFVERALINHVLANIGHRPGEFGYFLSLASVGVKAFSPPFDAWWCCVGTGMENPARYGEMVYFHGPDTLWVNLFMGSTLAWAEKGVSFRQETRFPEEDSVRLVFTCKRPVPFALKIRHPYWCEHPKVKINGKAMTVKSTPSSYMTFERTWKSGDTIQLRLPMALRLEFLPHSDDRIVAVMYGPIVLAGIVPVEPGVSNPATQRFADHLAAKRKFDAFAPVFVGASAADVVAHLRPTGGTFAEFRSEGVVKLADLTFEPLYRVYEEPYAVQFPLMTAAEWDRREVELRAEQEQRARWEANTLDTVTPGFQQSEIEHGMQSENSTTGDFLNRKWREAHNGWFSYEMAVDPAAPNVLVATYWGGEWQSHNFDILIDGQKIGAQKLRANSPGDFFEETYPIPLVLTKGKSNVTIRFQAHANDTAGSVYGLRTRRD